MKWHERMNRAIEYIESNLAGVIDMDKTASFTYQSATSFQRAFSDAAGISVSEYIRRRRLSLAAFDLKNSGMKVLEVASKYGYDSPDAFARAFKEIYGIPPSAVKTTISELKPFSRISFYMSIRGDVVMDTIDENNNIQIVNLYYERLPAHRLIGRRYTIADMDENYSLQNRWNEWFANDWYNFLWKNGVLPGQEYAVFCGYEQGPERAYWIGTLSPENTPVPDGFSCVDFPASIVGVCWHRGDKDESNFHTDDTHYKIVGELLGEGIEALPGINGLDAAWTFQRYDNKRFFMKDRENKVIMDHWIYLKDSSVIEEAMRNREKAEFLDSEESQAFDSPADYEIAGVSAYPEEAESHSIFYAMTTQLLKLQNISEATPYLCHKNDQVCTNCIAGCGEKPALLKHHLDLYHFLVTVSGVAFMIQDPNYEKRFDLKVMPQILPPLLEDRLDFAMKAAGFAYMCLDKTLGESELFVMMKESIHQDKPVLIKLKDNPDWGVIVGYTDKNKALYLVGTKGKSILTNWHHAMDRIVIVTGIQEKLGLDVLLERITAQLKAEDCGVKAVIPRMIDAVTPENAKGVAEYLNDIAGYMMECRWHAHECFKTWLRRVTNDPETLKIFHECEGHCIEIHDIGWEIWRQLGIGPHSDYSVPNRIGLMMSEKPRRDALKELFEKMWENDRAVLRLLESMQTN